MLINCSLDRSPSRQSSSSGDLLPEMMENKTPHPATPPHEVSDPEVSSQRVSPDPARPEGNPMATRSPQYSAPKESDSKGPYCVRSDALKDLLGKVVVSEAHRTLMGTVIERISSAESGLHEAFMSLLKGFEVRETIYAFNSTAYVRYAHADSSP